MAISKISPAPLEKVLPGARHPGADKPETASPQELLESLRDKQKLFATLKNEGLIHKDRHANLEQDLIQTIHDLEKLMAELEPK